MRKPMTTKPREPDADDKKRSGKSSMKGKSRKGC